LEPLATFFTGEHAVGAISIIASVVFLVLARLLLPHDDRDRTKVAGIYLALAAVLGGLAWIVPPGTSMGRAIDFFYWFFLLASAGRSLVLLAVDIAFGRRAHRAPPRIFRDLTQAVVYVIVLMLTLRMVGVEPGSLLTTSALLTAVVGLALQDTMGNLVSGLALQMQRPFEVGDWIQFETDNTRTGQVTEVNWRATTVMTSDMVELIIPNALLAKGAIRNFSRPSTISRRFVSVSCDYEVPPLRVKEAIGKAIAGTPGVVDEPAPWVQTKVFGDSGIEYTIWFHIDDYAARERIDGLVRDRVWYALQRARIAIPFPVRTVHMHEVTEESKLRAKNERLGHLDAALRCVDFLDVLPPETHRNLAAMAEVRLFAPGEVVVQEGDRSSELFIIDRGALSVDLFRGGRHIEVARLGPGNFFGEMGVMTGEPRTATVRAITECTLLALGHEAFHDTLAKVPEVIGKISDLLAIRQAQLEEAASKRPSIEPMDDRSKRLISQIKSFFKL
jgi:small-conductance mechanosensitive channel/CRP-like cAMP-binding protein